MQALGLIETKGFVAAIEAADSALKSASVSLVGQKRPGSGLVAIIITGDVAAVKSAVDAGTESASVVGEVVSSQVIARPHQDMDKIFHDELTIKKDIKVKGSAAPKKTPDTKAPQKKKSPSV